MKRVIVLMSTYNGENYLREQLDSILDQKHVDVTILVRDDGSKDTTPEILNQYSKNNRNIIVMLADNCGCRDSFYQLAKTAYIDYNDYDYYAFADQDDIWLDFKLSNAVKMMDACDNRNNSGKLYVSDRQLVDSQLEIIQEPETQKKSLTLEEAILSQPFLGCTMVFDYKTLEQFLKSPSEVMTLHDEWIYKVALMTGVKIYNDDTKTILYRQHGNNVVGGHQGFVSKWTRRFRYFTHKRRSDKLKQLYNIYFDSLTPQASELLKDINNYRRDIRSKFRLLHNKSFHGKYFGMFIVCVLTNRF